MRTNFQYTLRWYNEFTVCFQSGYRSSSVLPLDLSPATNCFGSTVLCKVQANWRKHSSGSVLEPDFN